MTNAEMIAADLTDNREWLAEAIADGDRRSAREFRAIIRELEIGAKIETGELRADTSLGSPANEGIHNDRRYFA